MSRIKKNSYSPCISNKENTNTENLVSFKNLCTHKRNNKSPNLISPNAHNYGYIYNSNNAAIKIDSDEKMMSFQ